MKRRVSCLPRWMHRVYAFLGGYFWLPCHLCGTYSGGHEWRDIDGKPSSVNIVEADLIDGLWHTIRRRRGICPACTREGLGDDIYYTAAGVSCMILRNAP